MKTLLSVTFTGMLLLTAGLARAANMPVLVHNDTIGTPFTTSDGRRGLDVVASEAFRRAGEPLRRVKLPAERGLISANADIEGGDLTRISGFKAQSPNLVRMLEKLIDWAFAAFGKNAALVALSLAKAPAR